MGISRPKITYLKDLAQRFEELPSIDTLQTMDDESIIKSLTVVKGIGVWTVQMLLIFRLQDSPESLKAPEKQERSSVFRALDRG